MKTAAKPQYKRFTRTKAGNFFYFFFLIFAGLFTILPLIYSVITSFKPLDEILKFPPTFFVVRPTFSNYLSLPGLLANLNVPLLRYIFNSLFVSIVATVLHIIVASMAAYALAFWDKKLVKILFAFVQFALLYNATTLAIPQYIIFSNLKMIDTYLVYILPYIPSALGVFLMKQFMEMNIPYPILEAARIDGAGNIRIFFQIVFSNVKPAWLTLTLFAFRDMWSMQPSGTIFSEELKTLPNVMSQITAGGIARSGSAMAATVILMLPPICVYLISQANVLQTMSSAGIKE